MSVIRSGPVSASDPEYSKRDVEFGLEHMKVQPNKHKITGTGSCNVSSVQMRRLSTGLAFLDGVDCSELIYVGTSTLRHIPTLASLFPGIHFHVYNPSSIGLLKTSNVTYRGPTFNDAAVREWTGSGNDIAMISEVSLNMEIQARWLRAIKPSYWMVTFRLPQTQTFSYLDGNLLYVPYTRLPELCLTGNSHHIDLPPRVYDVTLGYHDTVIRPNTNLFANVLHTPVDTAKYSDITFDNGFDSSYFLIAVLWYTWRDEAIAHPVGEANILAFAKRLMASLFW